METQNMIDIDKLTEKIKLELENSKDSKENNDDIEDFEKLIELEKLNKKMNKKKTKIENTNNNTNSIKNNICSSIKESFLIIILFILITHEQFNNLLTKIPLECFNNDLLVKIIKSILMSLLFILTKKLI